MYFRLSQNVFFILPALAVGFDVDSLVFFEAAWLNIAVGIGAKPQD